MSSWWKSVTGVFGTDSPEAEASDSGVQETASSKVPEEVEKPKIPNLYEDERRIRVNKILQWQDHWVGELPKQWSAAEKPLLLKISAEIESMGVWDQIRKESFFKEKIQPLINEYVEVTSHEIARNMQFHLNSLALGAIVPAFKTAAGQEMPQYGGFDALGTVSASASMIAGTAAVPIAVSSSIASTAGVFGLFATTTVAWPVVAGGAVVASVLWATGILTTKKMFETSNKEFTESVNKMLFDLLVYNAEQNAIAQQMSHQVVLLAQSMCRSAPFVRTPHHHTSNA